MLRHGRFGNPEFDCRPATDEEQIFRHSGWAARRRQVYAALCRCHKSNSRIDRFSNCGAGLMISVSTDGQDIRLSANHCKDRWCVPCQTARAAHFAEQLHRQIKKKHTRFLTLTLRHSPTPLADQIDRLYRSFLVFRRRREFKDHCDGGAAFFETKVSEKDGLWHVHLHCIVEGRFWEQRDISKLWHAVTGDSSIVDVRAVPDSEHVARYVAKYVTKPADSSVYAVAEKLDELIQSLGGRKLCMTFGTWRGMSLNPEEPLEGTWQTARLINAVMADAAAGAPEAVRLLEAAHRKWPFLAAVFPMPSPRDDAAP